MGILNVDNLRAVGSGTTVTCLSNRLETTNINASGIITATGFVGPFENTGDFTIDDYVVHAGDTDTKIGFPEADNFTVECAGNERFRVKPTNDVAVFSGSNSGSLTFRNDTSNEMQIHSGSSDALIFGSGGENERVRINSNGSIQITPEASTSNPYMLIDTSGDSVRFNAKKASGNNEFRFLTQSSGTVTERLRITSDGVIQTPGTTKIKPHTIGIGTTATTNTGVGTAYGEMMYNTTDDKLQIYTKSNKWYNVHNWTDSVEGYYKSITAASADGLNHYWPGNSSNSLISNLVPNNTSNSPVINLTVDSYHGTYPYFNFYSGNNELGWRFTKGGTKWGNGPFTIAFWVRPQASTLESESTFVQLGSHSGLRSLYTVSTDGSRQLKAITIGDDTGVHSSATLSTGWQHVVVTYETNRNTKYYINGSNVRTFAHSNNLDVGTSSQYIYIGYGHWNSSSSNKASMSQMSDIGIWDSDALTATEILNLYNAKRIISGY